VAHKLKTAREQTALNDEMQECLARAKAVAHGTCAGSDLSSCGLFFGLAIHAHTPPAMSVFV
jgi:hypothetical protein